MSWASSEGSRRSMLANRSRDTKPELAVRRALHAAGFRYRVDASPTRNLRSRADIVFTKQKIAVFIDGCFWHGCPIHATIPKRNADYWVPKLRRNVERDLETTRKLESLGWVVLRFWEHERVDDIVKLISNSWFGRAARAPDPAPSNPTATRTTRRAIADNCGLPCIDGQNLKNP
ncbi:very short patch repair endonuclease [Subtercola endophyticus]|uniref:very short patch repair endonuclease n=1 Tax=Subtercola endophyticus TaxID=2895559 RepID=UPI0028BDCFCE|nr:very short patch repair endonuclease [Subtercola endophyticus]